MKINAKVIGVRDTGFADLGFDLRISVPGQEETWTQYGVSVRYSDETLRQLRIGDTVPIDVTVEESDA